MLVQDGLYHSYEVLDVFGLALRSLRCDEAFRNIVNKFEFLGSLFTLKLKADWAGRHDWADIQCCFMRSGQVEERSTEK